MEVWGVKSGEYIGHVVAASTVLKDLGGIIFLDD